MTIVVSIQLIFNAYQIYYIILIIFILYQLYYNLFNEWMKKINIIIIETLYSNPIIRSGIGLPSSPKSSTFENYYRIYNFANML